MVRFACVWLFVLGCGGGKGGGTVTDGGPGSGIDCGGFAGVQCPANEWCDFGRNDCGGTDGTGTCRARPTSCDDRFDPVCGCDNQVHANECDAQAAGQDLNAFGSCPLDTDRFACGFRACLVGFEFCHVFGNDIGGEPDGFTCTGLPACAGLSDCDCLRSEGIACAEQCEGSPATGLTVTCLGG
jgi:hypothetical protein